jgi:membrane protein YqaA with SNARE-associated domain
MQPAKTETLQNAPQPNQPTTAEKRKTLLLRLLALCLSVAISGAVIALTTHFHAELRQLQGAGVLGLFVVSIIGNATVIIPTSVFVFACAGATVYGPLLSGIAAGAGSAIGEMTGYLAGYAGNAVIPRNAAVTRITDFVTRHGFFAVFIMAIIPNPLFDVAGIASGMIGMKWYHFLGAAILGKTVRLILVGWACHSGIPFMEYWFSHRK